MKTSAIVLACVATLATCILPRACRAEACAGPPDGINFPGSACFPRSPGDAGLPANIIVENESGVAELPDRFRPGTSFVQLLVPIEDSRILVAPDLNYSALVQWATPKDPENLFVSQLAVSLPRGIAGTNSASPNDNVSFEWLLNEDGLATGWQADVDLFAMAPEGAQIDHIHTFTGGLEPGDTVKFDFVMGGGTVISQVTPDLDGNGRVEATDFDELAQAIRTQDYQLKYDFKGDGMLDDQEFRSMAWYNGPTWQGDADLDGKVSLSDFLLLSENFGQAGGWADGNFNSNETVDFADFLLLSVNFGRGEDAAAASVPAPQTGTLLACGLIMLALTRRRR